MLRGHETLVSSPALLRELEETLVDVCGWQPAQARAARLLIEDVADVVPPVDRPSICRDPDDNEVLGVAQWAEVDVVVTGDKDLLTIGRHAKALIVTPRGFLDDFPEAPTLSG